MALVNKKTEVSVIPRVWEVQTWREESALFGMIKWQKLLSTKRIGEDLYVQISGYVPDQILINGVRYVPEITSLNPTL